MIRIIHEGYNTKTTIPTHNYLSRGEPNRKECCTFVKYANSLKDIP